MKRSPVPLAADSPTSILHAALAELGSTERPTSMDDPTNNSARRAHALWPGIVRQLLAQHPWNFAIARATLNVSGVAPTFGWQRRFALPADCLRWLPGDPAHRSTERCEREGDTLVSNATAMTIRYIALVDDTTRWSPAFVQAAMLALAAAMAEGVTQSEGIKDRLLDRAAKAMRDAKRIDGLETGATQRGGSVTRSSWLRARSRGAYGGGYGAYDGHGYYGAGGE
jgi:hypothetical protein